jgi:hypothetical protein
MLKKLKFNLVKKELKSLINQSPIKTDLEHSRLTLKFLLKLKPLADEAFQIAALAHDLDRAVTKITEKDLADYTQIKKFKNAHAARSAKFIAEILKKYHYPVKIIRQVKFLIKNHERGGNQATNLLMSADSLAYFKYNIPLYLKRHGEGQTKEKMKFMYQRLSPAAKQLVKQTKFSSKKIKRLFSGVINNC